MKQGWKTMKDLEFDKRLFKSFDCGTCIKGLTKRDDELWKTIKVSTSKKQKANEIKLGW